MPVFPPALARYLPALALIVLSCTWGYTWVLLKQGLVYASPFALAAQRCVGGAVALVVAVKLMGKSLRLVAPWETTVLGLVQITGFVALQTWALVEGGPGKTAVLIFTMPIWTLLLAWPILGERVRGKQWLAAASTLTGLAEPRRVAFDLKRLMRTRYRIDSFQATYFVIDHFRQLFDATAPDFTPVYAEVRGLPQIDAGAVLPGYDTDLPAAVWDRLGSDN